MCEKVEGMKEKDILLIYDNAPSHESSYSGWWMKNVNCYKMTICPYTPEFNPVERFFSSIKSRCSDGRVRENMLECVEFVVWNMNQIPKNHFKSFF